MIRLSVIRCGSDLHDESWTFVVFDDLVIVLDSYEERSRPSKRHKPRVQRRYARIPHRNDMIRIEDVPWPDDVLDEVMGKVKDKLKIQKEYNR